MPHQRRCVSQTGRTFSLSRSPEPALTDFGLQLYSRIHSHSLPFQGSPQGKDEVRIRAIGLGGHLAVGLGSQLDPWIRL